MGQDKNRRKDLETTREALAKWRRMHGGRGRPIPTAFWSDAAEVARAHGVASIELLDVWAPLLAAAIRKQAAVRG